MTILHLCIDMQKIFPNQDPILKPQWDDIRKNIILSVGEFDKRDIPSLFISYDHEFEDEVVKSKTISARNKRLLSRFPNLALDFKLSLRRDLAFKNTLSAYQSPAIREFIEKNGATKILLSGVFELGPDHLKTGRIDGCCVSETARDLSKAGYDVMILKEATNKGVTSLPRRNYDYPNAPSLEQRMAIHGQWGVNIQSLEESMSGIAVLPKRPQVFQWTHIVGQDKRL